jgi:hypothetical protein
VPLARPAPQGCVALARSRAAHALAPPRAKGRADGLRKKVSEEDHHHDQPRLPTSNSEARLQLAGDLRALAAFSDPDAAETLRRAADILERTAGALKLAVDHAQRAHDQSARAADYHNNSDACAGGNYMSIDPLPPWFAESSTVLWALTTDASRLDPDSNS